MEPGEIQMLVTALRKTPAELRVALLLSAMTYMATDESRPAIVQDFDFPEHVPLTTAVHIALLKYMERSLAAHNRGAPIVQATAVWLGNSINGAFPHLHSVEVRRQILDFQAFLSTLFGPHGQIFSRPARGREA